MARSGIRWTIAALAATLMVVACKRDPAAATKPPNQDSLAMSRAEPGFTPAEIRRDRPAEVDSLPAPTVVEPKVEAPAVAAAPAAVAAVVKTPAPKPVPVEPPAATVAPSAPPAAQTPAPAAALVAPGTAGDWVLQVNVHRSEAEAKGQVAKLAQWGIPAYAIAVPTPEANLSGTYWRVRVGRFTSRADAQNFGKSVLEPKGLKFWIDRKSNETRQAN